MFLGEKTAKIPDCLSPTVFQKGNMFQGEDSLVLNSKEMANSYFSPPAMSPLLRKFPHTFNLVTALSQILAFVNCNHTVLKVLWQGDERLRAGTLLSGHPVVPGWCWDDMAVDFIIYVCIAQSQRSAPLCC